MTAIDVTSAEPILTYVPAEDEEIHPDEVEARALSGNDVGRRVYTRAIEELGDQLGRPIDPEDPEGPKHELPDPRQPDQALVDQVIDELVASGRYVPAKATSKKAQAAAVAAAEEAVAKAAAAVAETPPDESAGTAETKES
jgi:hypothetical protein